jgi:hypothetical protein
MPSFDYGTWVRTRSLRSLVGLTSFVRLAAFGVSWVRWPVGRRYRLLKSNAQGAAERPRP